MANYFRARSGPTAAARPPLCNDARRRQRPGRQREEKRRGGKPAFVFPSHHPAKSRPPTPPPLPFPFLPRFRPPFPGSWSPGNPWDLQAGERPQRLLQRRRNLLRDGRAGLRVLLRGKRLAGHRRRDVVAPHELLQRAQRRLQRELLPRPRGVDHHRPDRRQPPVQRRELRVRSARPRPGGSAPASVASPCAASTEAAAHVERRAAAALLRSSASSRISISRPQVLNRGDIRVLYE